MANRFYVEPANIFQSLMSGVKGYDEGKKARVEDDRKSALAQLLTPAGQGSGTQNYTAIATKLAQAGDLSGATSVATLGKSLAAPESTDEIKEYNLAKQQGFQGSFFDFKTKLKQAGATKINNSIQTGENEYAKTLNKDMAERFIGYQKDAQSAAGQKGSLDILEKATQDPNFYSGTGAERFVLPLKQAIAAYGGDPQSAASMETFRAISSKSVLDSLGSLGAGVSNADRDFIMNQVPSLQNTPEGNKTLIDIGRKTAQRKQDVAKLAREYASKNNGRIDAGFDAVVQDYADKNPLFKGSAQQGGRAKTGIGFRFVD